MGDAAWTTAGDTVVEPAFVAGWARAVPASSEAAQRTEDEKTFGIGLSWGSETTG
jgi:hypothetical protein